jgi:Na+-driven multidrug efflux pump
MVCLEWWLFEIANMLSGLMPDPEVSLAVTGVGMQIIALAFMVPLGVSSGLRIRVANLLGTLHGRHANWMMVSVLRPPSPRSIGLLQGLASHMLPKAQCGLRC